MLMPETGASEFSREAHLSYFFSMQILLIEMEPAKPCYALNWLIERGTRLSAGVDSFFLDTSRIVRFHQPFEV